MNVNLSDVSASSKTPLSESSAKALTEDSENKGFLETLVGVFTDSQKGKAGETKPTAEVSEKEASSSMQNSQVEEESQEMVTVGSESGHPSTDTVLALESELAESKNMVQSETVVSQDVTRSMDQGQQLLGRIEQANQTLVEQHQQTDSGKVLPPGSSEWQAQNLHGLQAVPSTGKPGAPAEGTSTLQVDDAVEVAADAVQKVSIDQLEVIDTKLAQGQALTSKELEIIEGLKTGAMVVDLPKQALAQLVALPDEVKVVLTEQNKPQHPLSRQAAADAAPPQSQHVTSQELKPSTSPVTAADKTVLPSMPEALAAASTDMNHKPMSGALVADMLEATKDKQDKAASQHGLAGQLQAVVSQQGVTTPQQTRVDAAQQAQLPLQLTKELANEQVAEKVQMMMSKNLKNLDIRLDPPELGRMQIRMTMNSDLANVHFTVTNPQARDIIEQTLPRLREMLAQQGMQLADSSVEQQNSGQQQSGYAAEQNRQSTFPRGASERSSDGFDADVELDLNVASARDGISFYA